METTSERVGNSFYCDATEALSRRPSRAPNHAAENEGLVALAQALSSAPDRVLQKLAETALTLCRAHSAGFSLLDADEKQFYWAAIAGEWAPHVGGGTPRDFGPCGMVLDQDAPMLFWRPERHFAYLASATPSIDEGLLLPFHVAGKAVGTLWVMSHHAGRRFDAEDLRVMTNLASFASAAYQAGRDNEQRFREIINALPAAVYTTDAQGRLTHFNPAAERIAGRTPQLGIDSWCVTWKLYHADGKPMAHAECPMAVSLKEGRSVRDAELIVERPDGARGWFAPYPTPLRDSEGRLVGGINMLVDITERKQSEEALKEADRRKDEFMAMLAHELRNPLSAIALSTELLMRSRLEDEPTRFAARAIERQSKHLQRLADDLLDMARAIHGKLVLRVQVVDLLQIATDIAADYAVRRRDPPIEVGGSASWVRADPVRVRQMIENLIDNAIRYGGRRIAIRTLADGACGRLEVEDDGQGIRPELLADLFKPFVQGMQPLHRPQGGLGLGLALVERLAALHGGAVQARSDGPGKGSTFTLVFPACNDIPASACAPVFGRSSRRRVLVVEDDGDSRESLRHLLEIEGHEVAFADNGVDGLAKLIAMRPDIALVDIGLPGIDGYELARRARSLAGNALKLIAITGYGEEKDRQRTREAGFDLHLTKPVAYPHLLGIFSS